VFDQNGNDHDKVSTMDCCCGVRKLGASMAVNWFVGFETHKLHCSMTDYVKKSFKVGRSETRDRVPSNDGGESVSVTAGVRA